MKEIIGFNEDWVDVIDSEYLDSYIAEITNHYAEFFSGIKLKRIV